MRELNRDSNSLNEVVWRAVWRAIASTMASRFFERCDAPHDQADMRLALVALFVMLLEHPRRGNQRIERAVGLRQAGVGEGDRSAQHQGMGALFDLLDRPRDPPRRPHRQ